MTFAKHLKQIMETKNLTQTQLAVNSGLSKASVNQLLSGKQNPTDKTLNKLAQALECTPEHLIPKDDPDSVPLQVQPDQKNVPVEVAARRLGKSDQFVRVALQRGLAPFGFATKISGDKYSYHISPKLFEQYQGVAR